MIHIYHNPRCTKSRQTLQIIVDKGIEANVILYLEQTPSKTELKKVLKLLGLKPHDILRKGEEIYKTNFKGKALSDEEWLDALVKYPKLMERPIVFNNHNAVIGRPPENVLKLL